MRSRAGFFRTGSVYCEYPGGPDRTPPQSAARLCESTQAVVNIYISFWGSYFGRNSRFTSAVCSRTRTAAEFPIVKQPTMGGRQRVRPAVRAWRAVTGGATSSSVGCSLDGRVVGGILPVWAHGLDNGGVRSRCRSYRHHRFCRRCRCHHPCSCRRRRRRPCRRPCRPHPSPPPPSPWDRGRGGDTAVPPLALPVTVRPGPQQHATFSTF